MKINEETQALVTAVLFGALGIIALAWVAMQARDAQSPVALVFTGGKTQEAKLAAISQAEGKLIRFGASDNVIIAQFDHLSLNDIKTQTGAISILDAKATGACSIKTARNGL